VLVAHTYNLSYSGGRDQEDCSLRPAQTNSLQDPISKKPITHTHTKKKKKKKKERKKRKNKGLVK
jgi:hypothetical protein